MLKSFYLFLLFLPGSILAVAQTNADSIAYAIGEKLEADFQSGSNEYFKEIFHDSLFLSYFFQQDQENDYLLNFNRGFASTDFAERFSRDIITGIEGGLYFNFINYFKDDDGNFYLLFRLFGDIGLNYIEYYLHPMEDGRFVISDIFNFLNGEYLSETAELIYKSGLSDKVTGNNEDTFDINSVIVLKEILNLIKSGEKEKARQIFEDNVSQEMKDHKIGLLIQLRLRDPEDEEGYYRLIRKMHDINENSLTIHLINIDYYLIAEKYDQSLAAVDSLYDYTEDDFLDLYRGNINYYADRLEDSMAAYENLLNNYPYLPEAFDGLLLVYQELKQDKKMFDLLNKIQGNLELDYKTIDDFLTTDFPEVKEMKAYKDWSRQATSK